MYARECNRSRVRVAEEVLPVLSVVPDAAFQCSDPIPIVYGGGSASGSAGRNYHRRYSDKRACASSPRKPRRHQSPSASLLGRKYVAYQVDDLKLTVSSLPPSNQSQRTMYGTLPVNASGGGNKVCSPTQMGDRPEEEETLLLLTPTSSTGADCSSNQSETESDSDTGSSNSASSNSASSSVAATVASAASSSLQSILRIRSGDFSCRRVRKQASVEFAIDIISDEDEELAPLRRKKSSRACSSRCVPRCVPVLAHNYGVFYDVF